MIIFSIMNGIQTVVSSKILLWKMIWIVLKILNFIFLNIMFQGCLKSLKLFKKEKLCKKCYNIKIITKKNIDKLKNNQLGTNNQEA